MCIGMLGRGGGLVGGEIYEVYLDLGSILKRCFGWIWRLIYTREREKDTLTISLET
jgi:hypothetical protein